MEDILIEISILKSKAFSSSLPKYKIKSMILAQGVNPPPPLPKKKGNSDWEIRQIFRPMLQGDFGLVDVRIGAFHKLQSCSPLN